MFNDQIEYRFTGHQPEDVSILPTYFYFLNQYTRLKAAHPRKLPPFPRLQLNQVIKKLGWIPSEVQAVYRANELIKSEIRLTSKHTFIAHLSDSDRTRIADAKQAVMRAKPVSLATYLELPQLAGKGRGQPASKEQ